MIFLFLFFANRIRKSGTKYTIMLNSKLFESQYFTAQNRNKPNGSETMKIEKKYEIWIGQNYLDQMQKIINKYNNINETVSVKIAGWIDRGLWIYEELSSDQKKRVRELIFNDKKRVKIRVYSTTKKHIIFFKNKHHIKTVQKVVNLALAVIIFLDKKNIDFLETNLGWKTANNLEL